MNKFSIEQLQDLTIPESAHFAMNYTFQTGRRIPFDGLDISVAFAVGWRRSLGAIESLEKAKTRIAELESALKISTEQAAGFLDHTRELSAQIASMKEHYMGKVGGSVPPKK